MRPVEAIFCFNFRRWPNGILISSISKPPCVRDTAELVGTSIMQFGMTVTLVGLRRQKDIYFMNTNQLKEIVHIVSQI